MAVKRYSDFQKVSNSINIEFIEYGLFCGTDWEYQDLKAPFTRLYLVLEGSAEIILQDRLVTIETGFAYIVPSNMNFSCRTPKYLKKLYVHFNGEQHYSTSIFDTVNDIMKLSIPLDRYNRFYTILEEERRESYWEIKGEYTALIYRFISTFENQCMHEGRVELTPDIIELLSYMRQSLSAKMRTSDLANHLNISQSMLSKRFKSCTGISLKQYIQQQLMQQAQVSLIGTNKSIKEIASDLRYEDALYFSRVFSQWVGESPSSYRDKNRL